MKLELIYPKLPFWRAEISRLALHLGGVPFDNVHPTWPEVRKMKENGELPFGQVPILRVDGVTIAQTGAIARFCGKISGHYPINDALTAARIDQFVDAGTDITLCFRPSMRERNPQKRQEMRTKLATEVLPKWFGFLEKMIEDNGTGYCVGDGITIADLTIWRVMGWLRGGILDGIPTSIGDEFPLLMQHSARIGSIPEIQSWMRAQYG